MENRKGRGGGLGEGRKGVLGLACKMKTMSHCDIVTKEHDLMTYAPTTVGPNVTQLTLHARTQNSSTFRLRLFPQEKEYMALVTRSGLKTWGPRFGRL